MRRLLYCPRPGRSAFGAITTSACATNPTSGSSQRYAGPVFDFMQTLHPRLELGGCLFTHGLPYNDPTDPIAYYLGERPETAEGQARSFAASAHPVLFVGHFHHWFLASPAGRLPWDGAEPIRLRPEEHYLVVVAAVCEGWCAVFDTDGRVMAPFQVPAQPPPVRACQYHDLIQAGEDLRWAQRQSSLSSTTECTGPFWDMEIEADGKTVVNGRQSGICGRVGGRSNFDERGQPCLTKNWF